uniref:RRM domain-containing protein n=1 Tax=Heterorhabditis bacteriophora TaxID=37862 RepID=A0A1I7X1M9_HETBA
MQLQPQLGSAYEGIPIFIVPQNGIGPSTVSFAALQRAAEIKAALANAPQEPKIDTSKHYHIFVGDLSPEVDNRALKEAFAVHGEVSEAKVIRDSQTQKSKGYGFVSFPVKDVSRMIIKLPEIICLVILSSLCFLLYVGNVSQTTTGKSAITSCYEQYMHYY